MKECVKIVLGVLALTIGASAPTLILETIRPGGIIATGYKNKTNSIAPSALIISRSETQQETAVAQLPADEHTINEKNLVDATWGLAWFTLLLASVALAQAGLFLWQLHLMRRGMKDAQTAAEAATVSAAAAERTAFILSDTAERELRAYVSASLNHVYFQGDRFSVRYRITNHGRTPAYDMTSQARIDVLPYPLPPNWQFPVPPEVQPGISRSALFPDNSTNALTRMRNGLGEDELAEVVAATEKRVFVYGIIRYRDAFKKQQMTRFCYSLPGDALASLVRGEAFERPDDVVFEAADQHHDST